MSDSNNTPNVFDTMTEAELQAEIKRLTEENAQLKSRKTGTISFKVTEKGGVSVYGLGRFPITLYRSQWEKLLAHASSVQDFIVANAGKLTDKPAA